VYDGVFANIYATLTGGAFLTGFALYLGMGEVLIGILAAIPYLATLLQLPASYHVLRTGRRKAVCVRAAGAARYTWAAILLVGLLPLPGPLRTAAVLALFALSHGLGSVSYVTWLSWTTEFVPEEARGRFFGTRNMLCGAAGMAAALVFGNILGWTGRPGTWGQALGFTAVFAVAVGAGEVSLRFLRRIPEPPAAGPPAPTSAARAFLVPFHDEAFRPYLLFACCWGFAVQFASPFFNVYLLRDLGYGFGFVATLGVLSSGADLVGMRLWGALSDRVKNRPILWVGGWVAVFLPLGYLALGPHSVVLPVLLHVTGGGIWSGLNLCSGNLMLRLSQPRQRPLYLAAYSVTAGLGAALGPVLGGLLAKVVGGGGPLGAVGGLLPLQAVILVSVALRFVSLQFLRRVREPEEATVGQLIRVVRSVRGMTTAAGFNFILHPFLEVSRELRGRRGTGSLFG
jgi:MFS family permease